MVLPIKLQLFAFVPEPLGQAAAAVPLAAHRGNKASEVAREELRATCSTKAPEFPESMCAEEAPLVRPYHAASH